MKGTSEEGTGRGMDDRREEASGGGIERGREGAREGNFKPGNLFVHTCILYTLFFSRWPLRQRPDLVLAEVSWVCNMTK